MKVFISWSGPQSQHIARAIRTWLRRAIQHLDPWMSELDIGAGQRWGAELWKELQDSHFGIVCYTADNVEAPWLHFEAGALAKAVEGRVCPYLYKIQPSAVRRPLSQFQMKRANEKETRELLQAINDASAILNQRGLRSADLDDAFETWWPKLEADLNATPLGKTAVPPRRGTLEIVEEILGIVRDLDRRLPPSVFETGNVSDIPLGALRNRKPSDVWKLLLSDAPKLNPEVIERWLELRRNHCLLASRNLNPHPMHLRRESYPPN